MERLSKEQQYEQMRKSLNEKQWRQYLAMEAKERGNLAAVAREAKVRPNTIRQGIREIEAGDVYNQGERIRKEGGGRKPLAQTDETLLADLEDLLQPKGDPMSQVQWTSKSLSHLVKGLSARGHTIKKSALAELLHQRRFSEAQRIRKPSKGKGTPIATLNLSISPRSASSSKSKGIPKSLWIAKRKSCLATSRTTGGNGMQKEKIRV